MHVCDRNLRAYLPLTNVTPVGAGLGEQDLGGNEMHHEDLMKSDVVSVIVLLISGEIMFALLLLIVVAAFTRA